MKALPSNIIPIFLPNNRTVWCTTESRWFSRSWETVCKRYLQNNSLKGSPFPISLSKLPSKLTLTSLSCNNSCILSDVIFVSISVLWASRKTSRAEKWDQSRGVFPLYWFLSVCALICLIWVAISVLLPVFLNDDPVFILNIVRWCRSILTTCCIKTIEMVMAMKAPIQDGKRCSLVCSPRNSVIDSRLSVIFWER